jgi:GT2 family glycosyltransferase/glycosyltransferase involved in cell wall biosynthesis
VSHLVFVTTELEPHVRGGAGMLVSELRTALEQAGHRVSVILAAPADITVDADDIVVASGDDAAGWDLSFMATSKAAAEALSELHARDPVDGIEIQDFDGLGFWALTHRTDLGIAEVPISVRFHGPVDLQTQAVGTSTPELDAVAAMEREVFAMADRVVAPSSGIAALVRARYSVDAERVAVGPPPVRVLPSDRRWRPGGSEFLVIGRLGEVKGSHDMIDAVTPCLVGNPGITVSFVGSDGWSASEERSMREWLMSSLPDSLRDRVGFVDHLDAEELAERIAASMVVVAPSRFESFNLAVHEARLLGAPVIVPRIPAFDGVLDEGSGAIVYDGTIAGLGEALVTAVHQPEMLTDLGNRPPPEVGDPLAPYEGANTEPWHLRSQGGLATAAIARVEAVWLEPRRAEPKESLGRSLLRHVPDGVFRGIKRVVPNSVKDRLRDTTDWGVEADRRKWEDRFDRATARVAAMSATGTGPTVSIVIPCYNQGEFIREALLSIFEQTVGGFDVVIVDDGSDDGTTTPLLASLDLPRVSVIHQENRGLPAARNAGIAHSEADLVVTLDADDLLAPTYLEALGDALAAHPDAAYAHCWAELFGDTHMIWATRPYNRYQLLLSNSVVGCVLLRKDAWSSVGGYDESMRSGNEDWDLWIRLMDAGYAAVQIREPLFRYRKHGVSMSVETESRYEEVLRDRTLRHPDIYDRDRMTALKADDYPLLTLVVDDPGQRTQMSGISDVDSVVVDGGGIAGAVAGVRGKYMARLPRGSEVDPHTLIRMCEHLEVNPDLGGVATASVDPIVVARTWSVFDTDGPDRVETMGAPGTSAERIGPGAYPHPAWTVPRSINGVPVLRQRPEEAGLIPDWVPS